MNRREFGYLIGAAAVAAAVPIVGYRKEFGWVREIRQYYINWDAYAYRWDVKFPDGRQFHVFEEIETDADGRPIHAAVEEARKDALQVLSEELGAQGIRGSQLVQLPLPRGVYEARNIRVEV